MTNIYNTSMYPLGSTNPRVLFNNASNLDDGSMNNVTSRSWLDRFGRTRKSWWGFEQDFADFLISSGFEPNHLTYVPGSPLQIDRPTQLVDRAGSIYRAKMPRSFPLILTGTWATDDDFLVDVTDSSLRQALAALAGGKLVGWERTALSDSAADVDSMLSAQAVNLWEYESYVVSKTDPDDPTTWDWSPAVQAACDFCNSVFPARPLGVSVLCRLDTPIVINRDIDGADFRDTFVIYGEDGGGFIVDSAMAMFTSTTTPVDTGTPPQPSPVSQTVELRGLVLTATDPDMDAYVFDGNKFLRVWVIGCNISRIKYADTPSYQQSIYFIRNNIREWEGMFFRSTGGCYDVRFAPGNLIEHGHDFLEMLGQTSDKDVTGCSVDGCCIEGLSGMGIRYAHARGVSITNNYFEANADEDIIANDFPAVTNRGITHSGNMHACSAANKLNPAFYPVTWGKTEGGVSLGNSSDHNMNYTRPDTQLVCHDHAVFNVMSDATRARPGDVMYGHISPFDDNSVYGDREWLPGSVVINNTGAQNITGWITPDGTAWRPFGPIEDGSFWRFPAADGTEYGAFATTGGAANDTSLYVRYSNGVTEQLSRVTVGAADSGGAGYRLLRLPN